MAKALDFTVFKLHSKAIEHFYSMKLVARLISSNRAFNLMQVWYDRRLV